MARLDEFFFPNLIAEQSENFVVESHRLPAPPAFTRNPIPRGTIVTFNAGTGAIEPADPTTGDAAAARAALFGIVLQDAPNTATVEENVSVAIKGAFLRPALLFDVDAPLTDQFIVKLQQSGIIVRPSVPV